jgi:hypothetical protein
MRFSDRLRPRNPSNLPLTHMFRESRNRNLNRRLGIHTRTLKNILTPSSRPPAVSRHYPHSSARPVYSHSLENQA